MQYEKVIYAHCYFSSILIPCSKVNDVAFLSEKSDKLETDAGVASSYEDYS
jgi:hypothetical protein